MANILEIMYSITLTPDFAGFYFWAIRDVAKMMLLELWRTKGGAYKVDAVLKVMVRGLEYELDELMAEAKQTMKRSVRDNNDRN